MKLKDNDVKVFSRNDDFWITISKEPSFTKEEIFQMKQDILSIYNKTKEAKGSS